MGFFTFVTILSLRIFYVPPRTLSAVYIHFREKKYNPGAIKAMYEYDTWSTFLLDICLYSIYKNLLIVVFQLPNLLVVKTL